MTGVYSIAEVIEDAITNPKKTVFCVLEEDGKSEFDKSQLKSLKAVADMVIKYDGVVLNSLEEVADFLNK